MRILASTSLLLVTVFSANFSFAQIIYKGMAVPSNGPECLTKAEATYDLLSQYIPGRAPKSALSRLDVLTPAMTKDNAFSAFENGRYKVEYYSYVSNYSNADFSTMMSFSVNTNSGGYTSYANLRMPGGADAYNYYRSAGISHTGCSAAAKVSHFNIPLHQSTIDGNFSLSCSYSINQALCGKSGVNLSAVDRINSATTPTVPDLVLIKQDDTEEVLVWNPNKTWADYRAQIEEVGVYKRQKSYYAWFDGVRAGGANDAFPIYCGANYHDSNQANAYSLPIGETPVSPLQGDNESYDDWYVRYLAYNQQLEVYAALSSASKWYLGHRAADHFTTAKTAMLGQITNTPLSGLCANLKSESDPASEPIPTAPGTTL